MDIFIFSLCLPKKYSHKILLFSCFFVCIFSLYTFNVRVHNGINDVTDKGNISTRGHYFYMRDGYHLFLRNPIIGVGLGNVAKEAVMQNILSSDTKENLSHDLYKNIDNQRSIPHAHNTLVMYLAQFGMDGAIIFLLLYGSMLFLTLKNYLSDRKIIDLVMLIIICNRIINGFVDYTPNMFYPAVLFLYIYGLYLNYKLPDTCSLKPFISSKKYLLAVYSFIIFVITLANLSKHFT